MVIRYMVFIESTPDRLRKIINYFLAKMICKYFFLVSDIQVQIL